MHPALTTPTDDALRFWRASHTIRRPSTEAQIAGMETLEDLLHSPHPPVASAARRTLVNMGLLPALCLAE